MLAALAVGAFAAPLVHEGDPEWAERAVADHSDTAVAPRSWLSLTRGDPVLTSGASTAGCRTQPLSREQLSDRLDAARADFDWGDFAAAEAAARALLDDLPCLDVPVHDLELERAWRLLGASRFHAGDLSGADDAFAALRATVADPAWDETLPDQGRTRMQGVAPRLPVPITRIPDEASLLVDGLQADEVPPGPHLIQWRTTEGARGAWIEVPADGVELAVPLGLQGLSLEQAIEDDLSGFDEVLAGTWGPGTQVWVVSQRAVYRGTAGGPLEELGLAPEVPTDGLRWSVPILAVGAAGTVAGGVSSALALWATGRARVDYQAAGDGPTAVDARERFETASAWVVPAEVTLAAGGAVLATGLVLHLGSDVSVGPGGRGLQLRGRLR